MSPRLRYTLAYFLPGETFAFVLVPASPGHLLTDCPWPGSRCSLVLGKQAVEVGVDRFVKCIYMLWECGLFGTRKRISGARTRGRDGGQARACAHTHTQTSETVSCFTVVYACGNYGNCNLPLLSLCRCLSLCLLSLCLSFSVFVCLSLSHSLWEVAK